MNESTLIERWTSAGLDTRRQQDGLPRYNASTDPAVVPLVTLMHWCARLGSNQQPLPSEGSTLSIELRTQRADCRRGGRAGWPGAAEVRSTPRAAFRVGAPLYSRVNARGHCVGPHTAAGWAFDTRSAQPTGSS